MSEKLLLLNDLHSFADTLIKSGFSVVAPSKGPGPSRFRRIGSASELLMPDVNTEIPPKEHLFPPTEPILFYRFHGTDVELLDPPLPAEETVFLGLRPCDAAGIALLDAVFLADPKDSFYEARRSKTTLVSVACTRVGENCFCSAVGLSPHSKTGSDVLLIPIEGGFLAEAATDRGRALLEKHPGLFQPTDASTPKPPEVPRAAAPEGLDKDFAKLFAVPHWQDAAKRCLGCGACASVCPTCHCFDIVDDSGARGGVRLRCWDACGLELFTRHASGHNPRPNQPARFRQRLLHKFAYSRKSLSRPLCVGCGRCVDTCPVGMDIYEVAVSMSQGV